MPPLPTKRTGLPDPIYPEGRSMKRQIAIEVPLNVHQALMVKAKELQLPLSHMILLHLQPYIKEVVAEYEDNH